MGVHYVYDGHGTEDEEQGGGYIAKTTYQLQFKELERQFMQRHLCQLGEHGHELLYVSRGIYHEEVLGIEQEHKPEQDTHSHGGGRTRFA